MKRFLILALVCLNLVLVGVLAFGVSAPKAQAQVRGRGPDYMMITGHYSSDEDALYVIDIATRRMAAWTWDKTSKRLVPYSGRELDRDFNVSR